MPHKYLGSRIEVGMDTVTTHLDTLVRETHKPEAEVMTWAFQVGLRQLWRERTPEVVTVYRTSKVAKYWR